MFKKALFIGSIALVSSAAMAACDFSLEGTDTMQYQNGGKKVSEIVVPASCKDFTINLKHIGKQPKTAMGHNVVITKASDAQKVDADGSKAGAKNDYLKPNDSRVIAHSGMVGGGESTSVTFPVEKIKGSPAKFFCSFPGHFMLMQGKLTVK